IEIKPSASNHAPLRILQKIIEINNAALSNHDTHSDTTLEHGLKSLHQLCPKGSDIIMLSDFVRYQESDYSLISQIRR
ncbi:DUF58 domain-containing protein, partial [Vibrio sp. 10N.222.55.E8]